MGESFGSLSTTKGAVVMRLDTEQRSSLEETCQHYQAGLNDQALSYLHGRGLDMEAAQRFRLGLVNDPQPDHRIFDGRLAIPIIKKCGVVAFKFKCIRSECILGEGEEKHEGHAKYLKTTGDAHLYNTLALDDPADTLELTEGEHDCQVLAHVLGLPTVGIPGTQAWTSHPWWRRLFRGYKHIRIWADNDEGKKENYGRLLAERVISDLPQAYMVEIPPTLDVTKTYLRYGPGYLLDAAGL